MAEVTCRLIDPETGDTATEKSVKAANDSTTVSRNGAVMSGVSNVDWDEQKRWTLECDR